MDSYNLQQKFFTFMQQHNHQPKAIIFDMDGVIITTSMLHETAWRRTGELYNLKWPQGLNFMKEVFGTISADSARLIYDNQLSGISLEEFIEAKDLEYEAVLAEYIDGVAVDGIVEFINELVRQKYRLAVATSARREEAQFVLKSLNILDKFEVVMDSSQITKAKPDPEVYLKTLQKLGLEAHECVAFEDSSSGIRAVTSAGIRCILVKTTMDEAALVSHGLRCEAAINNFLPNEISITTPVLGREIFKPTKIIRE